MVKQRYILIWAVLASSAFVSFGCSNNKFSSIRAEDKSSLLSVHAGLSGTNNPSSQLGDQYAAALLQGLAGWEEGSNSGVIGAGLSDTPNPMYNYPVTAPISIDVVRWCRGGSREEGGSLRDAHNITIDIWDINAKWYTSGDAGKPKLCSISGTDVLNSVLTTGKVTFTNCDLAKIQHPFMLVRDENGKTLYAWGEREYNKYNVYNDFDDIHDDDLFLGSGGKSFMHMLYQDWLLTASNLPALCDAYRGSPVVIDMRSVGELSTPFELTSPSRGVQFDILGENANPVAHAKKKISWMKDPRVMPLVLPLNGRVYGIDQLFGDNTPGPDGRFAENGFLALKKYDGYDFVSKAVVNADNYITEEDQVYSKLRLWYDENLNGEAEESELLPLSRAGVEMIDLNYDPGYYSRDGYGNEIKYKTVVKLSDGSLRPSFDIWYAIYNRLQ